MNSKYKTSLLLFIVSILTPYVGTIFIMRQTGVFIMLPICLFALILLIISTIRLLKLEPKRTRQYYSLIAVGAVILYLFSLRIQVDTADFVHFKFNENELSSLVASISSYKKINQMSDGYENLNGYPITTNIKYADTTANVIVRHYFIDHVLTKYNIDRQHYESFRQLLISTGYRSFCILEDGTISFTQGGMIDNCYGIAYSNTGIQPMDNDCGRIIGWTKISDKWYAWATT